MPQCSYEHSPTHIHVQLHMQLYTYMCTYIFLQSTHVITLTPLQIHTYKCTNCMWLHTYAHITQLHTFLHITQCKYTHSSTYKHMDIYITHDICTHVVTYLPSHMHACVQDHMWLHAHSTCAHIKAFSYTYSGSYTCPGAYTRSTHSS